MENKKRIDAIEARIDRLEYLVENHRPIPGSDGKTAQLPVITGLFANVVQTDQDDAFVNVVNEIRDPAEPIIGEGTEGSTGGGVTVNDPDSDIFKAGQEIIDMFKNRELIMKSGEDNKIPSGFGDSVFTGTGDAIVVEVNENTNFKTSISSDDNPKNFSYPSESYGNNNADAYPNVNITSIPNSYLVTVPGKYNVKTRLIITNALAESSLVAFNYFLRNDGLISEVLTSFNDAAITGNTVQLTKNIDLEMGDIVSFFATSLVSNATATNGNIIEYSPNSYFTVIKID